MKKDAYCPPDEKDDMPIGSMMKGMMKKKVASGKVPPKKKDSRPSETDYA